jgi:hypothetical protein
VLSGVDGPEPAAVEDPRTTILNVDASIHGSTCENPVELIKNEAKKRRNVENPFSIGFENNLCNSVEQIILGDLAASQ